ncbi:hypothetical protein MCHIJ_50300 [Mycolicibacterium chitae]|nr:hypothetical protein MCHIJ_50300 [Mycolicibacterium chitae]
MPPLRASHPDPPAAVAGGEAFDEHGAVGPRTPSDVESSGRAPAAFAPADATEVPSEWRYKGEPGTTAHWPHLDLIMAKPASRRWRVLVGPTLGRSQTSVWTSVADGTPDAPAWPDNWQEPP